MDLAHSLEIQKISELVLLLIGIEPQLYLYSAPGTAFLSAGETPAVGYSYFIFIFSLFPIIPPVTSQSKR
jgi:hypothetical protein